MGCIALTLACHTPESHPHVDSTPSAIPSASAVVSASASASASVAVSPPPLGPIKRCGETGAVLTGATVTGFVASPASIEVGKTNGKRALVLGDPKWAECDIIIEETAPILPGPFAGASGSDATWKAVCYSSPQNVYVVVLDGTGTVRGLAAVRGTPFGNQGHLESRDVFADGHSIFYSGTVSADGWEMLEAHLYGFVDGKLAAVFSYDSSVGMGSLDKWDVTTSPVGATPPTVTVDLSTRESIVSKAGGGFRKLKPETRHTIERWNGRAFR